MRPHVAVTLFLKGEEAQRSYSTCCHQAPLSPLVDTYLSFMSPLLIPFPDHDNSFYLPSNTSCITSGLQIASDLLCYRVSAYTFQSDAPIAVTFMPMSSPLTFWCSMSFLTCVTLIHAIHLLNPMPGYLDMAYEGHITGNFHAVKVLFVSGATACVMSGRMASKLGLDIRPSYLKSVATAAGRSILGTTTFRWRQGPASFDVLSISVKCF